MKQRSSPGSIIHLVLILGAIAFLLVPQFTDVPEDAARETSFIIEVIGFLAVFGIGTVLAWKADAKWRKGRTKDLPNFNLAPQIPPKRTKSDEVESRKGP